MHVITLEYKKYAMIKAGLFDKALVRIGCTVIKIIMIIENEHSLCKNNETFRSYHMPETEHQITQN